MQNQAEENEVIWSAESFTLGFALLGVVIVVAIVIMGAMATRFPALRSVPLLVGVCLALVVLGVGCRRFLFGRKQLRIGKDRFAVVEASGKVSKEIPYSTIAEIKVFEKTVTVAPETVQPVPGVTDFFTMGAVGTMRERAVSTMGEVRFLGIRFHDAIRDDAALNSTERADLLARARIRGKFQGCDWVIGADVFQAPLEIIKHKIRERWLAFQEHATGGGRGGI
ncbi:MAG: hypothetical protein HY040_11500 [Planctomycetes bacterium]|nr:hypothetical protein [Planctomycetota bacterium]